jgi:hypothetical protein
MSTYRLVSSLSLPLRLVQTFLNSYLHSFSPKKALACSLAYPTLTSSSDATQPLTGFLALLNILKELKDIFARYSSSL